MMGISFRHCEKQKRGRGGEEDKDVGTKEEKREMGWREGRRCRRKTREMGKHNMLW